MGSFEACNKVLFLDLVAYLSQHLGTNAFKKDCFHLDGKSLWLNYISDMEAQIHLLEQEAYTAVLRAFKAQSDAISWDKESLITDLRRELRVSDDEHRELLSRVNKDDTIQRIRDWRQGGGSQVPSRHATNQGFDVVPSPTFSASRKKQKPFQSYPSFGAAGNRSFNSRVVSGGISANESAEALIGRKVWTKWPEDNNFYEAIITQYNAAEGRHALVYDIHAANETWEWVDLKEIPPEDIRWDGEESGVALNAGLGSGSIRGNRRNYQSNIGRGRGPRIHQPRREFLPTQQNGGGGGDRITSSDDIELFNTDSLVKEVERVFDIAHPDPFELDKAKKMLKEHEQALIAAIARLADTSDGELGHYKHKPTISGKNVDKHFAQSVASLLTYGDPPDSHDHPMAQG
ncbi:BnaA01g30850D [Brassica napus]|uniref:BnaA01g30850D protein n=1 Tax=Brassica napus TaxID=3708 RepID=A0A078IKQ4_BRANA|nr:BnaA01g30850D [Brassica napus]